MSRGEKLARYRHLREINTGQQTGALNNVAADTILALGRRLGITHGRTLQCETPSEMQLLFDLAVYTGKTTRSRGIDRYARQAGPSLTTDEAMMLRAAQSARFRLWRIERRHEIAGLWATDIFSDERLWLIDEGMEASCPARRLFAGRLMVIDDFVMTCGVLVPLSVTLLATAMESMPNIAYASREEGVNDPRFAIGIYRSAIETGTMEGTEFLGRDELAQELALTI